ncbi:MAG: hypothetical protein Athens071426_384 [Parcubacteria group bacterium Athens0714_26]|nr:MAG: hypothetical protein Athens101426_124 [Parcubacteria group bacterium Athens1014_26]TSD02801.1 MAG: hypothetical protein Athens071426_384 [Parcubacteria group bacterium Athens0714_26]
MKKYKIIFIAGVLFILSAYAVFGETVTFEQNLHFGLKNDLGVTRLQQFLTEQGVYGGPINGNFFSLTLAAVKKFQENNGIVPVSGFFGVKSRETANQKISADPKAQLTKRIADLNKQLEALQIQLTTLLATQISQVTATTTTSVITTPIATTTLSTLPNPFNSALKIEQEYSSITLSRYTDVLLTEFKFSAVESIAITRLRLKNNGTLSDANLVSLRLVASKNDTILATVDSPVNGIIDFKLTADLSKSDKGLMVSGNSYYVMATIITPNTLLKPKIRLDVESASDVSAFDYNDLNRVANITSNNSFPIVGPTISLF